MIGQSSSAAGLARRTGWYHREGSALRVVRLSLTFSLRTKQYKLRREILSRRSGEDAKSSK